MIHRHDWRTVLDEWCGVVSSVCIHMNIEKKNWSKLNCNINGCDSQQRQTSSSTQNSCHISFYSFLHCFIRLLFLVYRNSSLFLLAPHQTQRILRNFPRNQFADKTVSLINCSRRAITRRPMASICQSVVIFSQLFVASDEFREVLHGHRTHRLNWMKIPIFPSMQALLIITTTLARIVRMYKVSVCWPIQIFHRNLLKIQVWPGSQ